MNQSPVVVILVFAVPFLGGLLASAIWVLRCKHAWTLVSDRDFPPPIEDAAKAGRLPDPIWSPHYVSEMSRRTYIAVVKCDKCGHVKILKEKS